jgi:hypothetical protein
MKRSRGLADTKRTSMTLSHAGLEEESKAAAPRAAASPASK